MINVVKWFRIQARLYCQRRTARVTYAVKLQERLLLLFILSLLLRRWDRHCQFVFHSFKSFRTLGNNILQKFAIKDQDGRITARGASGYENLKKVLGTMSLQSRARDCNELYDGIDDILHNTVDRTLVPGDVDLYDEVVLGCFGDSLIRGRRQENAGEKQATTASHGKATLKRPRHTGASGRKIPLAHDDLVNKGAVLSQSPKNPSESIGCRGSRETGRHAVLMGNLTWWTDEEDILEACKGVGIRDVINVKIYETEQNGYSKGYCRVSFSSESSVAVAFEKLGEVKIHDNNLKIKPDTNQSIILMEAQAKTRPHASIVCHSGETNERAAGEGTNEMNTANYAMNTPDVGVNRSMRQNSYRAISRDQSPRDNRHRPDRKKDCYTVPSSISFVSDSQMKHSRQMMGVPRGPPPQLMSSISCRYYGKCSPRLQYGRIQRQEMLRPHINPAFLKPICLPPGGILRDPYSEFLPPGTVSELVNQSGANLRSQERFPASSMNFQNKVLLSQSLTEEQAEELLERNNLVSTAAIERAVNEARNGEFAGAIDTLVTAIAVIQSSKIAEDQRCVVLINSLNHALEGIENRSYGSGRTGRSASRDKGSKTYRDQLPNRGSRSENRHEHSSHSRTHDRDYRGHRNDRSRRDRGSPTRVERDPRRPEQVYRVQIDRPFDRL